MNIAFLCTGIMGAPMARNLLKAGHAVSVWNRTLQKARALEDGGAQVCESIADAVRGREVIFVMASDSAACDEVLFGENNAAHNANKNAIVIVCSSLSPSSSRAQAQRCAREFGLRYADAPVSGGERGAKAGSLAIMAGANKNVFKEIAPVLKACGKPTHIGDVGSGQLAKLANQTIVGVTIAAVSEALLLAERGGANPQAVREALLGGFANSEILRQHGERMINGSFDPGGPAKYQLKDLRAALADAEANDLQMPCAKTAAQLFADMIESGMGEKDHSALHLFMKTRAQQQNGEQS